MFESPKKADKEAAKKEDALKNETARMLKTIVQLTLERDFLQDCLCATGRTVPKFDPAGR